MNHLSRLLAILTLLKSKRILTGSELAEKFDVSLRTIYRDIKKLQSSGVPVMSIEGKGYALREDYMVRPIMFSEREVNALITAEMLIAKTNDASLIYHFQETLTKIKSVFKPNLLDQGERLNSHMHVFKRPPLEERSSSLLDIQMAVINFKVLKISYQAKSQAITERQIEPVALYSINEVWIVIGWCRLRDAYRSFRLDRIKHLSITTEGFSDRKFDLMKYFLDCAKMEEYP